MGTGTRTRAAWAAAWLGAAAATVLLAGAQAERYPLSQGLIVLGVLAPSVAVGAVLGRFRWALLALVYLPLILAASLMTENGVVALLAPVGVLATGLAICVGVAAGRRGRARGARARSLARGVAVLALATSLLPAALAYVDRHRTVRAARTHPVAIDEAVGRVAGVGLGASEAAVTARFGAPGKISVGDGIGTLADTDDYPRGPVYLPNLRGERDLRYEKLFFAVARRVRYLEVTDREARLSRGVGVGDSISLLRRAYPGLECDEGDAGEDEPIPYPRCFGRTGRGVYIYVSGDYGRPGAPIREIWLANFPLAR